MIPRCERAIHQKPRILAPLTTVWGLRLQKPCSFSIITYEQSKVREWVGNIKLQRMRFLMTIYGHPVMMIASVHHDIEIFWSLPDPIMMITDRYITMNKIVVAFKIFWMHVPHHYLTCLTFTSFVCTDNWMKINYQVPITSVLWPICRWIKISDQWPGQQEALSGKTVWMASWLVCHKTLGHTQ